MTLLNRQSFQDKIILQERIRQAQWGFNLSITFVGASAAITLCGIILLLTGRITQGTYAAIGGVTSTAIGSRCIQMARDANDRLDRIAQETDTDTE
jgi:hypothetical protein